MQKPTLVQTSAEDFVPRSVALLKEKITSAIADHDFCILGLSGGSTPKPIYDALGQEKGIDWSKVWVFLIDERYVPRDNNDSNQKLIRETLLFFAQVPETQLLFPKTTVPLYACVDEYEQALTKLLEKGPPDVITLGIGEDGHIASLFPPVPDQAFHKQLVLQTETDRFAVHDRISVTMRVLQASGSAFFFLKGEAKKKVWDDMMQSEEDVKRWPAKGVMEKVETGVVYVP